MVSCFLCMKKLPDECTCNDSFKSKKLRFIRNAMRELEIIKKFYLEKWKPKVMVNGEFINEDEVKVTEGRTGMDVKVVIPYDKKGVEIVLFDSHDEPLYRKVIKVINEGITMKIENEEYTIVVNWRLGWGEM